jgi:IMP dehydrogenase
MRIMQEALTFDDVLLLPAHSLVLPRDVSLQSQLTRDIQLQIPVLSAAMDTVTEARLAITLAQEGGIGIIHKNLTIDAQAAEVRAVKKFESGVIKDPITVSPDTSIRDVIALTRANNISGVPVVDGDNLVGIVTSRDRRLHKHRIERVLVINKDFKLRGMVTVKDIQKSTDFPYACKDEHGRLRVGAAVGTGGDSEARIDALAQAEVDVIIVDTAHGHSQGVLDRVRWVKQHYPQLQVIGGNIATGAAARALVEAGADAVKVGIGPGSICTTRIVAGIGVPQISAVANVADELRKDGIPLIADGGIRYSGDLAKALAAGAWSVMIGGMLAGTEEAPGEVELYQGRSYKAYRGMGSLGAMKEGSSDRYFQEGGAADKLVPEGIEGRVPYKGSMIAILHQLMGGLRSSMGYTGCASIDEMRTKPEFIRVTNAGMRESHVHDVSITKEAPNYRTDT